VRKHNTTERRRNSHRSSRRKSRTRSSHSNRNTRSSRCNRNSRSSHRSRNNRSSHRTSNHSNRSSSNRGSHDSPSNRNSRGSPSSRNNRDSPSIHSNRGSNRDTTRALLPSPHSTRQRAGHCTCAETSTRLMELRRRHAGKRAKGRWCGKNRNQRLQNNDVVSGSQSNLSKIRKIDIPGVEYGGVGCGRGRIGQLARSLQVGPGWHLLAAAGNGCAQGRPGHPLGHPGPRGQVRPSPSRCQHRQE
jgi:hypothetical protein